MASNSVPGQIELGVHSTFVQSKHKLKILIASTSVCLRSRASSRQTSKIVWKHFSVSQTDGQVAIGQPSMVHEMYCHDLEAIGLNQG